MSRAHVKFSIPIFGVRSGPSLSVLNSAPRGFSLEKYGVARNTLTGFIGICELNILDRDNFNTVVSTERCGKQSVKDIELRCRAALSEYRAQSKRFKEEGRLLPFFPTESFYTGK